MNRYLLAAALVTLVFTSCDSETTEETYVFKDSTGLTPAKQVNVDPQPNVQPANINQPGQPNVQQMPVTLNNGTVVSQPMPVITNPQTAVTKTAPGMNPPHGQPGHRCDIAVGAPLNSKPTQPTMAQPQQTVTPQLSKSTAPGMNPPHGQPGHRCDIAVGAPLNSKPVTQPVVSQPSQKDVQQPIQQATQLPVAKKDSGQ